MDMWLLYLKRDRAIVTIFLKLAKSVQTNWTDKYLALTNLIPTNTELILTKIDQF